MQAGAPEFVFYEFHEQIPARAGMPVPDSQATLFPDACIRNGCCPALDRVVMSFRILATRQGTVTADPSQTGSKKHSLYIR